jgi:hypothetical protein
MCRSRIATDLCAIPYSDLAPERGFEPRTLRLTDRCSPFRNDCPCSQSAAECRRSPACIAGVAVQTARMACRLGSMLLIAIDVSQEVERW